MKIDTALSEQNRKKKQCILLRYTLDIQKHRTEFNAHIFVTFEKKRKHFGGFKWFGKSSKINLNLSESYLNVIDTVYRRTQHEIINTE